MELTKVSTCVQGSPHFGQDRVFLSLPPPPSEDFLPPPPEIPVGEDGGGGEAAAEPLVVGG